MTRLYPSFRIPILPGSILVNDQQILVIKKKPQLSSPGSCPFFCVYECVLMDLIGVLVFENGHQNYS